MPGGKIENGESPVAAAERETLEETGYKVRVLPDTELRKNTISLGMALKITAIHFLFGCFR